MTKENQEVDDYINQFSGEPKDRLLQIRRIINNEVPEAQEGIMYALIGYKLNKKPLVYFGSFPHHTGFYATPDGHEEFEAELSKYKRGKGSVQFPHDQPLPVGLISRMVKFKKEQLS